MLVLKEAHKSLDEKRMDEPSFSLGLTQEDQNQGQGNNEPTEVPQQGTTDVMNVDDNIVKGQVSGKSKASRRQEENQEDEPSLSLGLTQEDLNQGQGNLVATEMPQQEKTSDINVADNIEEGQLSRKSKRQRAVPSDLVEDYQCGRHIMSRVRKSQKFVFGLESISEMEGKYASLATKLSESVSVFSYLSCFS